MKFYKTLSAACLGMALTVAAAPAAADDMDVLGQFFEKNFPTQNDPMEAFAFLTTKQAKSCIRKTQTA